jgi:hypothetical protein
VSFCWRMVRKMRKAEGKGEMNASSCLGSLIMLYSSPFTLPPARTGPATFLHPLPDVSNVDVTLRRSAHVKPRR